MIEIKQDQDGNFYFLVLDESGKELLDSRDLAKSTNAGGMEYCPYCGQKIRREDE